MLILFHATLTPGTILCCVIFFLYGCRLGGYLAYRELKSSSYKKNMVGEIKDGKTVPMGVKLAIWVTCALLYATQVSPVFYRMFNATPETTDNAWVFRPRRSIPSAGWTPASSASSAAPTTWVR